MKKKKIMSKKIKQPKLEKGEELIYAGFHPLAKDSKGYALSYKRENEVVTLREWWDSKCLEELVIPLEAARMITVLTFE